MIDPEIGARLVLARNAIKLTQEELCDASGIPVSTLKKYEGSHREPGSPHLARLARAGINVNWLLTGEEPMLLLDRHDSPLAANEPQADYVAIPLYNGVRAAAGAGALVEHERPDDVLMFKEAWIRNELGTRPQDLYLIRVAGDSMEPTLRSGDAILVDRRATKPDREGVYIIRMNGMLLVKRLQAMPGATIRVMSDNHMFSSFDVTLDDLDGAELSIIGRVVWTGRRL